MTVQLFDSQVLVARIEEKASYSKGTYFRDRFFGGQPIFATEKTIFFDIVDRPRRLAPYVSPLVEGKLMEHRGFSTRSFEPPYLKPKHKIDPANHLHQRLPGESPFDSGVSLATRRNVLVDEALEDHDEAIATREEVQAVEALRLGQVTVSGEGYPTTVLSYGRAGALTVALAGGAKWDQAGVDPLANLETWANLAFTNGGARIRDWFMAVDSWNALLARLTDAQKAELFDYRRSSMSMAELGPRMPDYVVFRGTFGDFNLYTVSETYQDEDGNETDLVPDGSVFGASETALEGRMAYGAILDPRAGYAAVRAFPKNWIQEDPAGEMLMTQSAPLAVPLRPNASFGATVL